MEKPRVLVVDDDDVMVRLITRLLREQFLVEAHHSGASTLKAIRGPEDFDVALLDINLPDANGLDILKEIRFSRPDTQVIMMTAYGTIERAVEAMRLGAYDFLPKNMHDVELILLRTERACEQRRLTRKARSLDALHVEENTFSSIVGHSKAMRDIYRLIEAVAPTPSTVLIVGASGTGKELVARALHARSPRHRRAFLAINCAALQESLLESELFGHVRGAFTGAVRDKQGLFETASGGTLFLDEIGDMPMSIQVKLLRSIQEGEVRPVGGNQNRKVDVRVVAATNKDLKQAMQDNEFREDLFYRLSVIEIEIPPLRKRRDDIPLLTYYFLRKFAKKLDRELPTVTPACLELLCGYDWPGNVRELENVLERATLLSGNGVLSPESLPQTIAKGYEASVTSSERETSLPFREAKALAVADFERRYLATLLAENDGNLSKSARHAGTDRSNFRKLLKKYNLR